MSFSSPTNPSTTGSLARNASRAASSRAASRAAAASDSVSHSPYSSPSSLSIAHAALSRSTKSSITVLLVQRGAQPLCCFRVVGQQHGGGLPQRLRQPLGAGFGPLGAFGSPVQGIACAVSQHAQRLAICSGIQSAAQDFCRLRRLRPQRLDLGL